MGTIWFDPDDDATELATALEAEGYTVTVTREVFAGEDDLEDTSWRLIVEPFDERVVDMVDVYGGWLPGDERLPDAAPDLPTGPRTLKHPRG